MSAPAVIGIVLVGYVVTCIRTWRKIDRTTLPTEIKGGQARAKFPTLRATRQK